MEKITLHDKQFRPYIPSAEINSLITQLGNRVSTDYEGKQPLFIAILNGAFMFASDLLKNVSIPCEISFIKSTSYEGTESTGKLNELVGLKENVEGRHLIILEDIVDTGNSMTRTIASLMQKNPASIEICTMLFKPEALQHPLEIKYIGKQIPNDFVVGYGLDYDGLGRNLDSIFVLA